MSDNTPTERFDAPSMEPETASAAPSKRLLYSLLAVGLALLIALVVVIVLVLNNGSGSVGSAQSPSPNASVSDEPDASESPEPSIAESESPEPEPSASQTQAAPPPADTKPHFTSFTVPKEESGCGAGPYVSFNPPVMVKWKATNAVSVWFVEGTSDAVDSGYKEGPVAGDQDDFENGPATFGCDGQTHTYTLTVLGKDGSHLSKKWTVKDTSKH